MSLVWCGIVLLKLDMETSCIRPDSIQSRQKMMVWGCLTANGKGPLVFLEGGITASRYVALLRDHLLPFIDGLPLSRSLHVQFQQDNATPHKAHATMAFLADHGISTPLWPAMSPDLNPIENCWALMKNFVRKQATASPEGLRCAIQQAWEKIITPSLCQQLYKSMRSRMNTIISHHGLRL